VVLISGGDDATAKKSQGEIKMKQKFVALFLTIVMVASALTAAGLATTAGTNAQPGRVPPIKRPMATTLTLLASTNLLVGQPVLFQAKLTISSTGAGLVGQTVTIWQVALPGPIQVGGGVTDSNGVATGQITTRALVGSRTYYATYGASMSNPGVYLAYKPSTSNRVTVTAKYPTTLTISQVPKELSITFTGRLTYPLTIFGRTFAAPIAGAPVTLWVMNENTVQPYGVPVTTTTNSNGVYTVTFNQNLEANTQYSFSVNYPGNSIYFSTWSPDILITTAPLT